MSELKGLTALIIEPHPGMRANLQNMLVQCGLTNIECAVSSSHAIRQMYVRSFDLILCENNLEGGQDGQQMLEDLRHHDLMDSTTMFFMVTGENNMSKVTSTAELAPAGYILKPFAAENMLERIRRALDKRNVFAPVQELIELGSEHEAIAACIEGADDFPRYASDFMRLRAELHMLLGEAAEAEPIYAELYAAKSIPWARLGQAKTLFMRERYAEARTMLEALLASHHRFLDAYDWLARVLEAQGDLVQTQAVLNDAVTQSPHALRRLRRLGQVALETGDVETAERVLREVVNQGRHSEFRDPEDHARLVLTLVRKGDPVQAAAVIRDLDKSMAGRKNTPVCSAIASAMLHEYTGNDERLSESLDSALLACPSSIGLSGAIRIELARNCLHNGKEEGAADVLREVMRNAGDVAAMGKAAAVLEQAGRHDLAERLALESRQQVADMVAAGAAKAKGGDFRGAVNLMVEAVSRLPDNPQVVFNAAVAVLKCLEHAGWDDRLGQYAISLIGGVRRLDPRNPKLPALVGLRQQIMKKYNIKASRLKDGLGKAL
jgi:DNA-binding NarL/FixJ family response regulator/Flp pilus assembly protein TadD